MSDREASSGLVCPKCQGRMRSLTRSGVTVEQCADCRGVFLDKGELERIAEAEDAHYGATAPGPAPGSPPSGYPPSGYPPQGYARPRRRKRGGFLEELFDF